MTPGYSPPGWMQAAGLPLAWRGHGAWRVLDTDFGKGERLAELWQAWEQDPHACRLLHVVVFAERPPPWAQVLDTFGRHPLSTRFMRELEPQWFGLLPGFHRLVLQGGRLHLTLCIGPMPALLREQQFNADTIVIGPAPSPSPSRDNWALKSLARLCRRGSTLAVLPGSGLDPSRLTATGWIVPGPTSSGTLPPRPWSGQYQPAWQIKATRSRWARPPAPVSRCVVVGAGLAGAGVAGALALRGWQVTVLDAAPEPASGASGLPVGLFAPQRSRDDGPRSRLARAGIRATLQAARSWLRQGQDWDRCGVAQIDAANDAATAALAHDWQEHAHAWTTARRPDSCRAGLAQLAEPDRALWHAAAGWIKPRQLVQAWLAQPTVHFQGNSPVLDIRLQGDQWQLFGPHGRLLAEAPQLVLACAGGTDTLLRLALAAAQQPVPAPMPGLEPVDGQVSWALHQPVDNALFPNFPVNGAGSVVSHVPCADGATWFAGATYERPQSWPLQGPKPGAAGLEGQPASSDVASDQPSPAALSQAHALNLARLAQLLPAAAASVAPAFASGAVHAWRGTRWTLADRLPLAGAWPLAGTNTASPGLWLSTAMGSRGLSHAALCGELIAAQLGAEPLPLDIGLHRCIDPQRVIAARHGTPATR